jgi:hypothetical protein
MPISKYYGGHGSKVMSAMQKQYGEKKGKQVFYATANKKGLGPSDKTVKKMTGR